MPALERRSTLVHAERVVGKPFDHDRMARSVVWKRDVAAKQRVLAERLAERRFDRTTCPICEAGEFRLFVEVYGYPYCECARCGHIFSQRPPLPVAAEALYAGGEAGEQSVQADIYAVDSLFAARVELVARPKVDFVSQRLRPAGRWIDIGCGVGDLVLAACARGWDASGIDTDPVEVAFGQARGARIERSRLDDTNAARLLDGAQVVSLINVLEHLLDPAELLRVIAAGTGPDTHVVLEVPRHPSVSSLANRAFPELCARHIYPPDHLHVFTEQSLDLLLAQSGLEAKAVWCFGQDQWELVSSVAATAGGDDPPLYRELLACVGEMQAIIDARGLSDTMFVITRKSDVS